MGVPKFFRWLSERYPLINQPIHCPPNDETKQRHGFQPSSINKTTDASTSAKRDATMNTNVRFLINMHCIIAFINIVHLMLCKSYPSATSHHARV
jgi:hypothetical protein